MSLISIVYNLIPNKNRSWVIFFILISFSFYFINLFSLGLLIPFFSGIIEPNIIINNNLITLMLNKLGLRDLEFKNLIFYYGIFLIILLFISSFFLYLNEILKVKLVKDIANGISENYISKLVEVDYLFFLSFQKNKVISKMLIETESVVNQLFSTFFELLIRIFVVLTILIGLVYFKPGISLFASLIIATSFFIIYKTIKNKLRLLGENMVKGNLGRAESINEIIENFISLKVFSLKKKNINKFLNFTNLYFSNFSKSEVVKRLPKIFLEFIFFCLIILVVLYLIFNDNFKSGENIVLISTFGIASYRLMPSIQQIFFSISTIRNNYPKLIGIYKDIKILEKNRSKFDKTINNEISKNFILNNQSNKSDVIFKANKISLKLNTKYLFKNLSFTIKTGSKISILGNSGSGKTSLLLIIMGLIKPTSGTIKYNGYHTHKLSDVNRAKIFSYSPQITNLFNESLEKNIILRNKKNSKILKDILKLSSLKHLYRYRAKMRVGNKLSGGELKRVLIARALYHNASILVFDEPTAYLDHTNGKKVIESIKKLRDKTIIFTTHDQKLKKISNKKIILNGS